jgi:hypothetical protein
MAQFPTAGYKSDSLKIYDKDGYSICTKFARENLFYVNPRGVTYKKEGDFKKGYFIFIAEPELEEIGSWKGFSALSIDLEGEECYFYLLYSPAESTYDIIVKYPDRSYYFNCQETDERPWDDDPVDASDMIEEGKQYEENPQYTNERINEFFEYLEKETGIKAGIAKAFIMKEFINDITQ